MSPSPSIHKRAEGWGVRVRKRAFPWKVSMRKRTPTLLTTGLLPTHPAVEDALLKKGNMYAHPEVPTGILF